MASTNVSANADTFHKNEGTLSEVVELVGNLDEANCLFLLEVARLLSRISDRQLSVLLSFCEATGASVDDVAQAAGLIPQRTH